MSNEIANLERELNQMIAAGQAMEAFERFYADDVVMQENTEPPREGKDACRKYEEEFFGNVAEFHEGSLHGSAAQGVAGIGDENTEIAVGLLFSGLAILNI